LPSRLARRSASRWTRSGREIAVFILVV
jgi:hypothetical protein